MNTLKCEPPKAEIAKYMRSLNAPDLVVEDEEMLMGHTCDDGTVISGYEEEYTSAEERQEWNRQISELMDARE